MIRRVAPVLIALTLAVAACGSDSKSAASSTTATVTALPTTTALATATTLRPGTTVIGPPIPIGQETTAVAATSQANESTSSIATTETGATATTVSTAGTSVATTSTPTSSTTSRTATSTSSTVASATSSTVASPNANTPFCLFEAEVDKAGNEAADDPAFIAALKTFRPRMDGWIANAPNDEQRLAATTMRDATTAAITEGDLDAFGTDDATRALLAIQLYCGSAQ